MPGKKEVLTILADLISIESVSGKEEEIGKYILEYLSMLGLHVEEYPVYEGGTNIVTRVGEGEPRLLVEAHMDVVPSLDMKNAFIPRIIGDVIYGRGACDVKGGIVSTFLTLEKLISIERTLPHQVVFAYVVDEEQGGRGASNLIENGILADYGIVIEPTNLSIAISASGCIEFKIECIGESGHAASLDGKNAITGLIKLLENLQLEDVVNEDGDLPNMKSILNIGRFSGGENPWMIPSHAEVECLLHFLPRHSSLEVENWLKKFISNQTNIFDIRYNLMVTHRCEGYELDREDPLVKMAAKIARKHLKREGVYTHMTSESDANQLFHKGGMPSILFGPGDIRYAHSSKEHININDVILASEILSDIVKRPLKTN